MIPKIIHQIWMTNVKPPARADIPEVLANMSKAIDNVMPDWTHIIWSEKNLPELPNDIKQIVYGNYSQIVISNILRYFLTYTYGGFYVDFDVECIKSFDDLTDKNFVCGLESAKHGTVSDAVFGCSCENEFMKKILSTAIVNLTNAREITVRSLLDSISTGMLTCAVRSQGVELLPQECFAPLDCDNKKYFNQIRPTLKNTYCIHHYLGKWASNDGRVRF